jgi:hypothetical protein
MRRKYVGCLIAVTLSACVDTAQPEPKIDPAYIQKNLLTEPPAQMTNKVDADFGGKVVYLGNDVTKPTVAPGDEVTVVHYWKVVEPPGEKWRVFTHLQGTSKQDWENIDRSDMRIGHGPDTWKAGEIIRDEHKFRLPKDWKSPYADVLVGLYPKGGPKVEDRMPVVSGQADAERRVKVARLQVQGGAAKAATEPPKAYVIHKASEPITIDGRADEAAWQRAPESPVFVTAEGSPEIQGATRGRLLWDDQHLYVFVTAQDKDVSSQYKNQDDAMWKEDVIELFIDADRNRRGYVELQVNPNNAQLDAWFMTTRAGTSDKDWTAKMKSAVTVQGTLSQPDDQDTGWDVEIAIPLAAVKGTDAAMAVNIPPRPGDTWRLNVVRVDKPAAEKNPAVASWNQITYQDFHALDRMLEVTFGDESGKTEAAAPAAAPGTTPAEGASGAATPAAGSATQTPAQGSTTPGPGSATPAAGNATQAPAGKDKVQGQPAQPNKPAP